MSALAGTAARGVIWGLIANFTSRFAWLAAMAVLARVLSPAEFGLYALGLVYVLYVETVSDLGFAAALIQWRGDEGAAAQASFVFNLALGVAWAALSWWWAEPVAALFHAPEGAAIVRALAPAFVIKGLGNTHDALCQKRLRFRERFLPEAAMALVKSALAVGLALAGFGVWSLVYAQLAGLAVWTTMLWVVVPWRPRLELPERALVGGLVRFGRWIVVVNLLAALVHHADKLVVGRELGTVALGLYQTAAKVIEVSITVWIWVVGRVLFPAFARLHAAGELLAPAYLRAVRAISLITLPGAATLALAAEPIVRTLFGPDWVGAVPILRALALYAAARSLGSSAGDVLKGTGAANALARLAVVKALLLLPALALTARHGATAVALAMAGTTIAGTLLDLGVVSRRIGIGATDLLRGVGPGLLVAAVAAAAVAAALALTREAAPAARLALAGLAAAPPLLAGLAHFEPGVWQALRSQRGTRPLGPEASST